MTEKLIEDLVEKLSELSVLEMSKLKTALEEKWDVKASAGAAIAVAAAPAGDADGAAAEATDFAVIIAEVPSDKKISVIKAIREVTSLGLKEAKELAESAPKEIRDSAPKAEAEELKKKLETAGAKVELKPV